MPSVSKIVGSAASESYSAAEGSNWSNPGNVTADDGSYATFSNTTRQYTPLLKCTMGSGNEFSIPAGSSIDGIEVEYQAIGELSAYDETQVFLVVANNVCGFNRASQTAVSATESTYTRGGSTDTFGVPLTVDAVNASDFGCALRFERDGNFNPIDIDVDFVRITVHYTESAGDISYDSECDIAISGFTLRVDGEVADPYRIMFPGFGTPKAVIFLQVSNSTTRASDDGSFPFLREGVKSVLGVATSNTSRGVFSNKSEDASFGAARGFVNFGTFTNQGTSNNLLTDFSSFGTDYVEIVQDDVFNAREIHCHGIAIAIGGSGVSAYLHEQSAMDGTANEENDVTTVGFEPDVVIGFTGMEESNNLGHAVYLGGEVSFCYNPGTGNAGLVQRCLAFEHRYKDSSNSNLADVETDAVLYTDRVHYNEDVINTTTYWHELKDFDANGFTVRASGGNSIPGGDDGASYLALKLPSGWSAQVGDFTLPTSTGSQSLGDSNFDPVIGFTPSFMLLGLSMLQTKDSVVTDSADGESWAVAAVTQKRTITHGLTNENGQSAVDASTWLDDSISLRDETGSPIFDADFESFDYGGLTATFNSADGTTRRGVFLAIGDAGGGGATTLTADAGSFTLSGQAATLTKDSVLAAAQGTFTVTGQDASLIHNRVIAAGTGTFTLTGQDATLTVESANSLVAEAGSFTLTGQDAALTKASKLPAAAGSFSLSGQAAQLSVGRTLDAQAGAFNLTGNAVNFTIDRVLGAATGSFALTGQDATLTYTPAGTTATFVKIRNATLKTARASATLKTAHASATLKA